MSKPRPRRKFYFKRRKHCKLCEEKIKFVDYKDVELLRQFTMERGKILGSRVTGTCAKHQRLIERAIKNARIMALMPYTKN